VAAHRYFGEPVKAAAVLYVKHLDRMRAFYQQRFGLEAASTAEDHCVLESGAWTLSLVVVRDNIAATIHVLEPPRRRDDAAVNPRSVFQTSTISGRSWQGWVARSFRGTPSGISRALDTERFSSFDFVGLKDADCLGQLTGAAELAAPASAAELTGAHPP
jgi:hypothetical protein